MFSWKKIKKHTVNVNFFNSFGQIPTQFLTPFMNKKTKFFKNVLLLQFIPVFLLGVFILSNPKSQKVIRIREIHPYEFNYGELLPLISFAVCCIVALFTLFLKTPKTPEDDEEIVKRKRKQNFWKFAFYCNVFLLLVIGIFSVLVFQKDALIIDQPVHFYAIIFSRFLLVIVISLVVASFLLAAGIYWKTNKSLATAILVFSFLILTVSSVFELAFVSVFIENSERHFIAKGQKQTGNQEEVYEDYGESDEGDDESEDTAVLLYDSWISLIENWGGTKGEQNFFGVRQSIDYSMQNHIAENENYYLVQFIDSLRNKPDKLYSEFEMYKRVFYSAVSDETYQEANFDKIVNGLLLAYEDIGSQKDKLIEIYRVMGTEQKNGPYQEEYFLKFESYFSQETIQKIKDLKTSADQDDYTKADLMWFYGFWVRRNNEGNLKEVALILKEIKEHYENSEE